MNLTFKILWAVSCALLFCGCGTPVVDPASEPMAVSVLPEEVFPAFGKLTLIRTEPEPTADEVLVYANNVLLAVIGNSSYVELDVPAGTLVLTLDWEDTPMQFKEEIELDTSYAIHKFLTISHQFDVTEISKKDGNIDYTMEETLILIELSEQFATNVIKNLNPDFSYVFGSDE
ncbi:MAG: hypothetical protein V5783_08490 [Pontiella sp.]